MARSIIFRAKVLDVGTSRMITVPKKWANEKVEVGAVLFDLQDKEARKDFYDIQEEVIERNS